jgi:fructose-bisphosphate aldolase, class I
MTTTAAAPASASSLPSHNGGSTHDLAAVAAALTARGKGIAATDESPPTLGRRLEKAGVDNTPAARAAWRACLYGADVGRSISGAIVFAEALDQVAPDDGATPIPALLTRQGVLVGVKADLGLEPLVTPGAAPGETVTKGLDGLAGRAAAWRAAGVSFTKWRAALRVQADGSPPTRAAIDANASQLAQYAVVCQAAGLVPIVEPEVLIDGAHDAASSAAAAAAVLSAVVAALGSSGADLGALLIKPTPILPGADCPAPRPAWADLAGHTLDVLSSTVPPAVPGVCFLSGGLSEADATACLDAINRRRDATHPWALTFSFGRALQASALAEWAAGVRAAGLPGPPAAVAAARAAFEAAARANAAASVGQFTGPHPADGKGGVSLREEFRGWRG